MSDFGQPFGDPAQQPAGGGTPPPAPHPAAPAPPPYPAPTPYPAQTPYTAQPQYPAPPQQPAQPYGAPPPFPAADPPAPKKSRTGLIIGIVVAVVLVLCLGVVAAGVALFSVGSEVQSSGGTSAAPTPSQQAAPITLTDPDRIGDLEKSADQSNADGLRATLTSGGIDEPFAAAYDDTATPGRMVVLWGGTGRIFGIGEKQTQLDSFFTSAGSQMPGASVTERGPVSPGAVGGIAECEKVNGMGVTMAICAWIGDDVLVGFVFTGYEPAEAGAAMPEILSAIVKR